MLLKVELGKKYYYDLHAIVLVYGTKYKYNNPNLKENWKLHTGKDAQVGIQDSREAVRRFSPGGSALTQPRDLKSAYWHASTGDGKKDLLNDYRNNLVTRAFINQSERALNQAGEFIYLPNGKIEHSGSVNSIDPTDRGDNHGDIVIADSLCSKVLRRAIQKPEREVQGTPVMSMAWRQEQRQAHTEEW